MKGLRFLISRAIQGLIVMFGVSLLVFFGAVPDGRPGRVDDGARFIGC